MSGAVIDRKFQIQATNPVNGKTYTEKDAILLCAKDAAVPVALAAYAAECMRLGANPEHVRSVRLLHQRVLDFQAENGGGRVPDTVGAEIPRCLDGVDTTNAAEVQGDKIPLPLYNCHKQVRAGKILDIMKEDGGAVLHLTGGDLVTVDAEYLARCPHLAVGGYFVQYLEGHGFTSYSPAGPFEAGYTRAEPNLASKGFDFGIALCHLKAGKRVARRLWSGKIWLAFSPGVPALDAGNFWAGPNREYAEQNGGTAEIQPCITAKGPDGKIVMGWAPSQVDMLAKDWEVV